MNYQEFFAKNREKVESEFVKRDWNEASGQPPEKLRENSYRFFAQSKGQEIMTRRAETMAYLLREGQIEVQPYELFADQLNHAQSMVPITWDHYNEVRGEIQEKLLPMEAAVEARAYTGEIDFGHTCPDWRALLELGYPGILRRLYAFLEKARSEKQRAFYHSCITVYEALEQWMLRLAEEAERKAGPDNALGLVAENLRNLTRRPPQTLHEALQLSFLSYFMQQELEQACVRSLGRFDLLYGPFYEADLQAGRLTREEAKALLQFYFCRWNARNITANIPITLCGTLKGREISSDFTRLVLEAYGELNIVSPKFHIRYSEALPADIEFQVLRLIRSGVSAFVFCSDAAVETALKSLGETAEDAEDYVMVGCYESTSMGREVACSCNGRLSFLKAVEYAMSGGMDLMTGRRVGLPTPLEYDTFEQFQEAVRAQLRWLADECMRRIALVERQYPQTFTTPFFSATMEACLEKGLDAYSGGARYNHSSINTFGIANAADAMSSMQERAEFFGLDKTDSFAEFKEKYLKAAESVENAGKSGIIKVGKVLSGHESTPKKAEPNTVIDHLGKNGTVNVRSFYDDNGIKVKDLHTGNHGYPKQHPFGNHGEHAHDYEWEEDGRLKNKTTREISREERERSSDIL